MQIYYYNDGKEKGMSHEIHLELNFNEETAMNDSKESVILEMKSKIDTLIEKLKNIDWNNIPNKQDLRD